MSLGLLKKASACLLAFSAIATPSLQANCSGGCHSNGCHQSRGCHHSNGCHQSNGCHHECDRCAAENTIIAELRAQLAAQEHLCEVEQTADRLFAQFGIFSHDAFLDIIFGLDPAYLTSVNNRITQIAVELGNFISQLYGRDIANQFAIDLAQYAALSEQFAQDIAASVDPSATLTAWRQKGAEIAALLASLSPNLSQQQLASLFDQQVTATAYQIAYYKVPDYNAAIASYTQSIAILVAIGDYLAQHAVPLVQ